MNTLEKAINVYNSLPNTDWTTEYTKNKGIKYNSLYKRVINIKCHKGVLIIPIYKYLNDTSEVTKETADIKPILRIINFQFIFKDGFKQFLKFKAGETKESLSLAFCKIQGRTSSLCSTYIVEGVSTGLSVCQALPEAEVIVAINDFNAIALTKQLKEDINTYKYRLLVILGELSKKTGKRHKMYTKAEYNNLIAYPDLKNNENNKTDWNDLHTEFGINELREQLLNLTFDSSLPIPIGHSTLANVLVYYVFSYRCNSILKLSETLESISTSLFSPNTFLKLTYAGGREKILRLLHNYLTDICLIRKETKNNTIVSWGIRKHEDRLIFNSGNALFELKDKKFKELPYTYDLCKVFKNGTVVLPNFKDIKPWKPSKTNKLVKLLYNYDFEHSNQALILIGFLAQSFVRGIKSYGGNVHVGGISATGKSKIKTQIYYPLCQKNINSIHVDGVDTSRQAIQRDLNGACLCVFQEEAENLEADIQEKKSLQRTLSMVREGTEGVNNCTVKIINDKPHYFLKCFSFFSMSILHAVKKQQDLNRFIFINLVRKKKSLYHETKNKVVALTNENSLGFSKLALLNAERYESTFNNILDYLVKNKPEFNDHKHRNLASNLAGFCIVSNYTEKDFMNMNVLEKFNWVYEQYSHTKEDDNVDNIDKFLSLIVPKGLLGNMNPTSLGLCVQDYDIYDNATNILKSHKIKYDKESGLIYFCPKADIFKLILKENDSVFDNIHENLKDNINIKRARYRINSVQIRGFVIDLNQYLLHKRMEE